MRTAATLGLALAAWLSLPFTASPAAAVTQLTVGPFSAQLPDADGFLQGDSDPYLEVRADGVLIGTTSVIGGNNNPVWPGTTFTTIFNPLNAPFLTVEIKAYDLDDVGAEYLGMVQIAYNWVAGNPVTFTTSVSGPFGPGYSMTVGLDANDVVVPARASTWGAIKALYR